MKDLQSIVNNFNLPVEQTQQDIVIDEFAKSVIDKVFDQLRDIFPGWKHTYKKEEDIDSAKIQWIRALTENNISTIEQIKAGFKKARSVDTDFLPSCGKFVSWCSPSAEDLGYPGNDQAMRECIKYRNNQKMFTPLKLYTRPVIIELCKRVDWFMINAANGNESRRKADKHFNDTYMYLITSGYQEPVESDDLRLPTQEVVNAGLSEQQQKDKRKRGLDSIQDIKRNLKRKGLTNN